MLTNFFFFSVHYYINLYEYIHTITPHRKQYIIAHKKIHINFIVGMLFAPWPIYWNNGKAFNFQFSCQRIFWNVSRFFLNLFRVCCCSLLSGNPENQCWISQESIAASGNTKLFTSWRTSSSKLEEKEIWTLHLVSNTLIHTKIIRLRNTSGARWKVLSERIVSSIDKATKVFPKSVFLYAL